MTGYEQSIINWYNNTDDPYSLDKDIYGILDGLTEDQLDGLFPYELLVERSTPYKDWLTELIDEFMKVKFPFD